MRHIKTVAEKKTNRSSQKLGNYELFFKKHFITSTIKLKQPPLTPSQYMVLVAMSFCWKTRLLKWCSRSAVILKNLQLSKKHCSTEAWFEMITGMAKCTSPFIIITFQMTSKRSDGVTIKRAFWRFTTTP